MGTFHGVQSSRKGPCCSFPVLVTCGSQVLPEKPVPAWASLLGPQLLLGVCSCVGSPQTATFLRAHKPSLDPLQAVARISSAMILHGLLQPTSHDLLHKMQWHLEQPPPLPSSLILMSAESFLSHFSHPFLK